jgi:hypothetical protein
MSFQELVEEVRHLPREEQEELQIILEQELGDYPEGPAFSPEAEQKLLEGHLEAMRDYREGKLDPPTSDVNELMRRLRSA